ASVALLESLEPPANRNRIIAHPPRGDRRCPRLSFISSVVSGSHGISDLALVRFVSPAEVLESSVRRPTRVHFASQSICLYARDVRRPWARRVVKTLTSLMLAGLTGVVLLVAGLWIEHASQTSLPQPTGPFAVGRTVYDWVDEAAVDALAPGAGAKRELLVWAWYPASAGSAPVDDYLPAALRPPDEGSTT